MLVRYYVFHSDEPFSHDYMKREIDQFLSISNVLTDLHVYRIHTAPGF